MANRPGPKPRPIPVPMLFMHVRCSVSGASVEALEPLRNELKALAKKYGANWGCRVKRRMISTEKAAALMSIYESMAVLENEDPSH